MKSLLLLFIPFILFASPSCDQLEELTQNFEQYATNKKEIESLKVFYKRLEICEKKIEPSCERFIKKADDEIEVIISYFHTSDIKQNLLNASNYMEIYNSCLKTGLK